MDLVIGDDKLNHLTLTLVVLYVGYAVLGGFHELVRVGGKGSPLGGQRTPS